MLDKTVLIIQLKIQCFKHTISDKQANGDTAHNILLLLPIYESAWSCLHFKNGCCHDAHVVYMAIR